MKNGGNMRKQNKKMSFAFEIIFLIVAMIAGILMLVADAFTPFLHTYVFVEIIILEAFCLAMLIAIGIIVSKTKNRTDDE